MTKNIIEMTQELVRMKTTADRPEELQRIVEYVAQYFKDAHPVFIKRFESRHKPSIVISTQDTLTPDIFLVGHLDVVPAPEELFEPRIEGTKMYGRGVCDMKSECAVMMRLMREIAAQTDQPNIALMLTTDEEVGGYDGVKYLLQEIGYRCKVAIIPDGGQAPDDIVLTNKGVLHVRLTASGKTGHGSRPWLGENAIDHLIGAYGKVRELFPQTPTAEDYWFHTCSIGTIQGGEATNQIPDIATADLDIRFTEEINAKELLSKVTEAAGKNVEVRDLISGEPIHTNPENPFVKMYAQSVQDTLGLEPKMNKHCGSNDGRFFTELGIPVIISRPISGDQHSPHEWLETASLPNFHRVLRKAVTTFQKSLK